VAGDQRGWLWALSLAAHGGIALAMGSVKAPARRDPVAITIRTTRPARPAAPAPTPAPALTPTPTAAPSPARPQPAPRSTAAAPAPRRAASAPSPVAASAAAPSASSGAPDFGLSLGNGPGLAVAGGGGSGGGGGSSTTRTAVRPASEPAAADDGCSEEIQRARPVELGQPEYPDAAREASIEGRVRVEVTVDEQGRVSGARVLQSLGYGCDEAALLVARSARFSPATRCGRAVRSTLTIGIRFSL
jgi:protein TonB